MVQSPGADEMKQRARLAFATRVKQGKLGQDVQIVYGVVGGMPSQRVQARVAVDSIRGARVEVYDARHCPTASEASIPQEDFDVARLFERVAAGIHSLLPASRAVFAPDTVVGSLTIRVQDDEETFYFVPGQERRNRQGNAVAAPMEHALRQLSDIVKRVMETQAGATHA